jgi:hypothetical protein
MLTAWVPAAREQRLRAATAAMSPQQNHFPLQPATAPVRSLLMRYGLCPGCLALTRQCVHCKRGRAPRCVKEQGKVPLHLHTATAPAHLRKLGCLRSMCGLVFRKVRSRAAADTAALCLTARCRRRYAPCAVLRVAGAAGARMLLAWRAT